MDLISYGVERCSQQHDGFFEFLLRRCCIICFHSGWRPSSWGCVWGERIMTIIVPYGDNQDTCKKAFIRTLLSSHNGYVWLMVSLYGWLASNSYIHMHKQCIYSCSNNSQDAPSSSCPVHETARLRSAYHLCLFLFREHHKREFGA